MAVGISQRSVAKPAILLRGKRFPRGLLLDIRWDSFSRSFAKPAILLRGRRFLRGLLLDIRWEYLNRSVAKRAILLRGKRFLKGLLLDIRWDPVNRSAAYFHYGPRWLQGSRWCNAATKCSSTIGYFLKNSSLGPYLCGLTLRHGKTQRYAITKKMCTRKSHRRWMNLPLPGLPCEGSIPPCGIRKHTSGNLDRRSNKSPIRSIAAITFGRARRRLRNRDHCGASGKRKKGNLQRREPLRLEFSTVRGLFYIKKNQGVERRIRHRKFQHTVEN